MPDFIDIFKNQSEKYDLLVSKEDYKGNLLKKIIDISYINQDSNIIDMGTGTGRIAFLLSNYVKNIRAYDKVAEMINTANKMKTSLNNSNIEFQ